MSRLTRWIRRTLKPLRARRIERDMDDEMRFHIQMEAELHVRDGVDVSEAHRRALASFGGVARFKNDARDAWPLRWAERIAADVQFAVRSLRHSPGFALAAVVALALGMGANTIVFSAVDSVAFRPLAIRSPDQLVALYGARGEASLLSFSYPEFDDLRRDARSFSDVAAVTESPVNVSDGDPALVWAAHVTDNYFAMLGVTPATGGLIRAETSGEPVVVLSHTYWATRFAASPAVIGQTMRVNGSAFTIVGVAPAQFTGTRLFTYEPSLWLPLTMHDQTIPSSAGLLTNRDASRLLILGRLLAGVSQRQATENVNAIAHRWSETYPERYRGFTVRLVPNRTPINPWLAPPERIAWIGRLLLLGTTLVLLIACANVASLLLARMRARREEIAVRVALGASRGRILQQLLTESLILAALGAVAAIPVAIVGGRGVQSLTPRLDYAAAWRPAEESRVLLYSVLITVAAAVAFGLAPAFHSVRRDVVSGLRDTVPFARGQRFRVRLRELLVVGQVTFSVVILATAGLFVRSLNDARSLDVGIAVDSAVAFTLDPQLSPEYDAARTRALYHRVEARLAALPGVCAVGRAMNVPLDGNNSLVPVFADGAPQMVERAPVADFNISSPGYFRAIGTPILAGRDFAPGDSATLTEAAIVNDVLAARLWPGESAIGKTLRLGSANDSPVEVIGVARVSDYRSVGERPRAALWLDVDREPRSRTTIVVRTAGDDASLIAGVRAAMRETDRSLPVIGLATLRDHVSVAYAAVASGAAGATGFAVLAALLTASGIFGLVAYSVSQRQREIGIRMALGARAGSVARLVVGRALALTVGGVALGVAIVAVVPMGIGRMLYGVSAHDPLTLFGAALMFCAVAVLAAFVPARRATRLDPMRVLRLTAVLLLAARAPARAQSEDPIALGRIAYLAHNSDEAIKWFEKAVALHEDSMMPHLWLGRAYVQALPHASIFRQPIIAHRARSQFDRAVELDPRSVDAREDRATYYMYAPSIAGGGIDKARAEAEVARGLDAYRGALLRGQIEQHEKNVVAAEAEYVALIKSDPDSAAPFNLLVGLYQNAHRYVDAFAAIDARQGRRANDTWATYQLGKTAALSGQRLDQGDDALRAFIAAGRFEPSATEANARLRLGMILEQKHDIAGARAEYASAIQLDPRLDEAQRALTRLAP